MNLRIVSDTSVLGPSLDGLEKVSPAFDEPQLVVMEKITNCRKLDFR
jgi:hypothetical protein